jgi:S1-C subfamily serine protease
LPPSALALTASQVYEQVKDSVVVVKAYDQQGKPGGLGSGIMLPSGDVITNYHVLKAGVRYTVGRGKQGVPATLKAGDPDKDLCLLTAPGLTAKPARLGQAARLKVGEPVYAVGAPQGLELSLSEGIVSQLRGGPPPLIQTTVAISGGSSGGGLFNAEGELVGITTFYLKDSQSLNFALPVEWIGVVAGSKIRERPRGEVPVAPKTGAKPQERTRPNVVREAQDWPSLLADSLRWTQAEPGNPAAWYNLGNTYGIRWRYYNEAILAYQEALRLKPDYADVLYNLARFYNASGQRDAALEAARRLRLLDPQRADKLELTKPTP